MPDGRPGPESGPSLEWAGSALSFTPSGALNSLRRATPGRAAGGAAEPPWLSGGGVVSARVGGVAVGWAEPDLLVDLDELEVTHRSGLVTAVVRHSFGPVWNIRLALGNPTAAPVRVEELGLTWTAPAARPSWALAAGAAGAYAVLGDDGSVLGGVLTRGEVATVTPEGFAFDPLVLPPGARYVVQWEWRWFASPRSVAAHRRRRRADRHVPTSLVRPAGDAALVTVTADEALVLGPGLDQQPAGDQLELTASAAGTYPVQVRSVGGVTQYNLCWAPALPVVLRAAAAGALAAPRNGTGVVVLPDVDVALVVQAALRLGCDEPDVAEEALDLFTARARDRPGSDPRLATYLCAEFDRTGDRDLVAAAAAVVRGATTFHPGLGLATGHLALARLVAGQPSDPGPGPLEPTSGSDPVEHAAARLEAALLEAAQFGGTETPYAALARLGRWLGAGLTGSSVRPCPPEVRAYATAVLAAVPDDVAREAQRSWAGTAVDLERWTEAGVLADLGDAPAGPAHAWLAVAARTR